MSDDPIERAARALASSNMNSGSEHNWRLHVEDVRAVLRAILDPGKLAIARGDDAACDALDEDRDSFGSYSVLRYDAPLQIWRAMIGAMLEAP